jgi:deazaflavin-dependent oxidoreductase (nitroreductase family)
MISATRRPSNAPAIVRLGNPIMRAAMRLGLPSGPNTLLTVRGRKTGEPRTAPVAVVDIDRHLYVIGAYGDVHWVRNLRAAGEADLRLHGRDVHVTAKELDRAAATTFFGETLPDYVGRLPWFGRRFADVLFGLAAPEIQRDPALAAATRPIFELRTDAPDPGRLPTR